MLQHGAYTLLLDSCYDREKFPTIEEAIDWCWASTKEEIEAVEFVLKRFFKLSEDGNYVQDRILEELLSYHSKADKNKQIAIDRETKRRENSTIRAQVVDEAPPNHKPLTINHKPLTTILNTPPEGVDSVIWDDFLKLRKTKKAPLTKTALAGIAKEGVKAGLTLGQALEICCVRGWTGFNSDWLISRVAGAGKTIGHVNKQTALEQSNQRVADKWLENERIKDAQHAS